jgi:hypothetical protein
MPNRDTLQHAREALATSDPSLQIVQAYRLFLESPPRKASDNDLHAWCLARIKDLCGATSFKEALRHPDVLTLLAFGYLGFVRRPDLLPPRVRQSMPVPKEVAEIEPEFFPVLRKEIRSHMDESPSFDASVKAAEREVAQLVASLTAMSSTNASKQSAPTQAVVPAEPSGGDIAQGIGAFIVIFVLVTSIGKKVKA